MKRKIENQLIPSKRGRYNRQKRLEREDYCFVGGSASGDEEDEVNECVKRVKMCNDEYRVYNYSFKKIDKNNIPSYIK